MGETENIEYNRDKGMSVTVYFGQRRGHASTSDLASQALRDTVDAACTLSLYTAADDFCGLAERDPMECNIPDLVLHRPWDFAVERALSLALKSESGRLAVVYR